MAGLRVHAVVTPALDGLALALPQDARPRVADEGYLDDGVLALVEEGRVAEPRRNVDLGRHCSRPKKRKLVTVIPSWKCFMDIEENL